MKLPNFVIAGFAKCGTTSLYHYLYEHPEVFLPKRKELHYFTYESVLKNKDRGPGDSEMHAFHVKSFSDYKRFYEQADKYLAVGEVSPSYANYTEGLNGIKSVLGQSTKVVLVLREPIDRMYSNYLHLVREGREELSFADALKEEESRFNLGYSNFWRYKFTSSYYDKIREVKNNFDNVFIITFEDFVANRKERIGELYRFLGVDDSYIPKNIDFQFNAGGFYKKNILTKLIFHRGKINSFLKRIIPLNSTVKIIASKLTSSSKVKAPEIEKSLEKQLINEFRSEVEKLKKDFGVRTEFWKRFS